jgi:lipopolysaccharide export LptBFGC system permease protein LptF
LVKAKGGVNVSDPLITTLAILGTLAFFAFVGWIAAWIQVKHKELLENDLTQTKLIFDAIRRIEEIEREIAAKHRIGWIREASEN